MADSTIPFVARVVSRLTGQFSQFGYAAARRLASRSERQSPMEQALARLLAAPHSTVIDAGANVGQFADLVFRACPTARVISIDPIPENVEHLRQRFADRAGYRVTQAALGEQSAPSVTFNVLPYTQASSLLKPSGAAKDAFRSLQAQTRQISVPMRTLDELLGEVEGFAEGPITLVKLDVEGFEAPVLRGAKATLARAGALMVECQTQPMNEGAELFDEVCHQARLAGLRFTTICGEVRDLYNSLLMLDLLFERR